MALDLGFSHHPKRHSAMATHRPGSSFNLPSADDVITCLNLDAGTRTLGELIRERQLALSEILRLRAVVNEQTRDHPTCHAQHGAFAAQQSQTSMGDLLTLKDVCSLVALARSSVYGLMRAGKFPRSVQVSGRAVRWRRIDIERWQSSLTARPQGT